MKPHGERVNGSAKIMTTQLAFSTHEVGKKTADRVTPELPEKPKYQRTRKKKN